MILPASYFQQENVVHLAKDLIGKILLTRFSNKTTACIITETEAYAGIHDKASHAYNGKLTKRTKTMFEAGGIAYIYLIYGIHSLFNIVTNQQNIPHAVLIRGGYPISGFHYMRNRNGDKDLTKHSLRGPGKLSKLMGIHYSHDSFVLDKLNTNEDAIWIEDESWNQEIKKHIICSPRIGIDYAEEDALLPYRFALESKADGILESFKAN